MYNNMKILTAMAILPFMTIWTLYVVCRRADTTTTDGYWCHAAIMYPANVKSSLLALVWKCWIFSGNIKVYLYFLLFLNKEMAWVIEIKSFPDIKDYQIDIN